MLAAVDLTLLTIFVLCSTELLRPRGEKKLLSGLDVFYNRLRPD